MTNEKDVTPEEDLQPFDLPENEAETRKTHYRFFLKEKIGDMIKYAKPIVARFPKREWRTANEMNTSMLTMYRLAIVIQKKYYKKTTLQELDIELDVLRHFVRLAHEKDYYGPDVTPPLSKQKYANWSAKLDEIGRIIGGLEKVFK